MLRIATRGVQLFRSPQTFSTQWQYISKHWVYTSSTSGTSVLPVFRKALQYQDNVALTDEHGEHTYGHIHKLSGHLAWLMQNVLGEDSVQQRIAFLCPNDVSYVITQWATWMAGHIAVPLCPKHPSSELEYFVRDSEASIIVTTSDLTNKIKPILSGQQVIVLEDFFFKPSTSGEDQDTPLVDLGSSSGDNTTRLKYGRDNEFYSASDALIIYTSGTTGRPKGVVLSHKNVLSQMSCLRQAWGWTSGDAILHCLPLHHVHGIINALLCPLYVGARVVMLPQFSAPAVWSQLLSLDTPVHSRVNLFMAVPTMYVKLIEEHKNKLIKNARMQEYVKSVCTQNIRLMVSGSAALPEPIFEQWQQITGHTLLERYGMTEIGMALSNPLKGTRKPGFVGSPLPGVEVCIAKFVPGNDKYEVLCHGNSQGTEVMSEGDTESGELLVRGPNVFKEYWKNSQATLKEFTQDGWFKTGDTAQYTDGAYKILGRTSVDIIKSGGFKISALDVERHLLAHPNIVDVAVVGIPDITWGQKVAAVVEVSGDENLDPLELRKWGQERMPHYQVPSVIVSVTNPLPRNNMGKVNKKNILKEFFPETASVP
ncbi:malonate--CoA ligase ACSF3, mitochondrial-like [Homarus americanus]|uniref:malonate--CoA ligase ACSF3, mitochondrial-like n=1 Tax=Homarus americanus TaxID=6706 RepID=UPI001C46EC3A|nr:malonate--CoA ligase ACSF3, mitochondrial-like [Homarus americanus]